jgi:hypothetical protein
MRRRTWNCTCKPDAQTDQNAAKWERKWGSSNRLQRFDSNINNFLGLPGGAKGDRTPDLGIANAALSQLSYRPVHQVKGLLVPWAASVKLAWNVHGSYICHQAQTGP